MQTVNNPMAELLAAIEERLAGFGTFETCQASIQVNLFHLLLDLSVDTVRRYRGDFFYDAEWIQANVVWHKWDTLGGQMHFFFCFDDAGTYLSADPVIGTYRRHAYRMMIQQRGQQFFLVGGKVKG